MSLMAGLLQDGRIVSLRVDHDYPALVNIPAEHWLTHEGYSFASAYTQQVTDTNDISAIAFNTPVESIAEIHLVVEGQSTDQVEFRLIESPSIDEAEATGTITPYNRKRGSTNTSLLYDCTPVKATGEIEWTGVGVEGEVFYIGTDKYMVAALEATATAASAFWVDLGDAALATVAANAETSITANDTVGVAGSAALGVLTLTADNYGAAYNYTVTADGTNAVAVSMTGGVGALNADNEYYGTVNKLSYYDKTDAATANITTTTSLIYEIIGQAAGTPASNAQHGESRADTEWVLKPSTQYCLYMKSLNANDNVHIIRMRWYEVPPSLKSGYNDQGAASLISGS